MIISEETANSLMNAFANVYMDTHEPTGDYETDKTNIENAARAALVAFADLIGINEVKESN